MTVDPTYLLGAGAYLLTGVLYEFYRWLNYVRVKANQVNSQIVPPHTWAEWEATLHQREQALAEARAGHTPSPEERLAAHHAIRDHGTDVSLEDLSSLWIDTEIHPAMAYALAEQRVDEWHKFLIMKEKDQKELLIPPTWRLSYASVIAATWPFQFLANDLWPLIRLPFRTILSATRRVFNKVGDRVWNWIINSGGPAAT